MSDSEPARKKARKQVSFREANETSPLGRHNGVKNPVANDDGGNSLLPRKIMDGLEEIQMEPSTLTAEDLANEDNEVWVLHCPANVDPARFLAGEKIKLEGQTEYEMEGTSEKYEVVALPKHDSSSSLAALLPGEDGNAKLVGAPISGYFMIKEKIEEIAIPALKPEPKPHHRIPDGIKERHPIYGVDFEEVFKSMDRSSLKPKKKKKSKKHETIVEEEVVAPAVDERRKRKSKKSAQPELIVNPEETDCQSKKKSKYVNGWANGSIKEEPETPSESKKKKKKRHREEPEIINGSYVNGYTNGHHHDSKDSIYKNIKKEKVQSEDEYSSLKHKKSKKKSKYSAS